MRYYTSEDLKDKTRRPWLMPLVLVIICAVLCTAGIAGSIHIKDARLASEQDQAAESVTTADDEKLDLGNTLRQRTVSNLETNDSIRAYTISEIREMDVSKPSGVTVADLKLVTRGNFVGLEEDFWQVEQDYGINCLFVMAIGANESAFGTVCFRKNNMFGFGGKAYATKADNIDTVAHTLATKYLTEGASCYHGKTIDGVHKSYAASPVWDDHVAKHMANFYSKISAEHNKAIEALK